MQYIRTKLFNYFSSVFFLRTDLSRADRKKPWNKRTRKYSSMLGKHAHAVPGWWYAYSARLRIGEKEMRNEDKKEIENNFEDEVRRTWFRWAKSVYWRFSARIVGAYGGSAEWFWEKKKHVLTRLAVLINLFIICNKVSVYNSVKNHGLLLLKIRTVCRKSVRSATVKKK